MGLRSVACVSESRIRTLQSSRRARALRAPFCPSRLFVRKEIDHCRLRGRQHKRKKWSEKLLTFDLIFGDQFGSFGALFDAKGVCCRRLPRCLWREA